MSNLDDFFAKKDKKKKGKKSGFSKANTDVLAKNLEENDRKEARAEEKANVIVASSESNMAKAAMDAEQGHDDEWKAFDDDKKDYSNLKIEALKVNDEPKVEEEEEHEINEEGEKVRVKRGDGGPWNKLVGQPEKSDSEGGDEAVKRPNTQREEDAALEMSIGIQRGSIVGGSYVPPHMRSQQPAATSSRPSAGRRQKHAPDFNSEVYFPSLSASVNPSEKNAFRASEREGNSFEEVRTGGSQTHSKAENAPKLTLDNKFHALRD